MFCRIISYALGFLFFSLPLISQDLRINELQSFNISFSDEFGATPDWLELYNRDSETILLEGWGLSDDRTPEDRWLFENTELEPGAFLLVFASGRDIRKTLSYETVIREGDDWQYIIPGQQLDGGWRLPGFDASGWLIGSSGFGYDDGDDQTTVPNGTRSVFIRKVFNLEKTDKINELLLHMDYDDAFIAYLNGTEIVRANIGIPNQETPYYTTAITDHEAKMYTGGLPDKFDVSAFIPELVQGENVLAIQVHNISTSSSDMSAIPFLTLGSSEQGVSDVPEILEFLNQNLHTDFKLSSEGETLYLFDTSGQIADSIAFPAIPRDVSFGRETENSDNWVLFEDPTPGTANNGDLHSGEVEDSIQFSHKSGFYNSPVSLTLTGADTIYYTLDATEPDQNSNFYAGAIVINKNTLVKAKVFINGKFSQTYANTYFFNVDHSLPVLSLNTKEEYLWDNDIGMYVLGDDYENNFPFFGANFWEDWEYPFYLHYFDENKKEVLSTGIGAKIFGGWTRGLDQKSFSLFARSQYGDSSFEYPFFNIRPYSSFESVILRNGGNDWDWGFIRDVVMTSLLKDTEVDFQAYQPIVCYLNGEYWGIYNMREKISEHFIASLHDVDVSEVDLLEHDAVVKHGDNAEYLELRSFIQNNSLVSEQNYEFVMEQIDELNFIQYFLANIYYDNTDWPGNNIRYWKVPGGKWRWIMFDTDFGLNLYDAYAHNNNTLSFALQPNGPHWPNPPWSTLFLRKLVNNITFRNKFINHFADAMNSVFLPEFTIAHVDAVISNYKGELPRHRQRWDLDGGFWQINIERINNFFLRRPSIMRSHIRSQFNLPATRLIQLKMNLPKAGTIKVNSLNIEVSEWSGFYFENVPITVTVEPKPGYIFEAWSGDLSSNEDSLTINLSANTKITANFKTISVEEQPIVINEINYNSPEDQNSSDWVELHNFSSETQDISGWILKDDDDSHSFKLPENTVIDPKGFLVLCRSNENFTTVYPEIDNYFGEFDFGFSAEGDAVRLYDHAGVLMDSVAYLPISPWPEAANGQGPTLELISPELDNALAKNWRAQEGNGTPGNNNHVSPPDTTLYDSPLLIYPNPGVDQVTVRLTENEVNIKNIRIYDAAGRFVMLEEIGDETAYHLTNISGLERGVYILMVTGSDNMVYGKHFEKL